ncbi:MAG TPA: CHAP domain-containing protein [Novosphingobium sp.]
MTGRVFGAICAVLAMVAVSVPAQARVQCVAYARAHSDVQVSGNARDWWANSAGVYRHGQAPQAGAVLAFRATGAMPMGHVAVVSKVLDGRRVLLDHANWSRPGMVERGVLAVDVSEAGDWSSVRVWFGPTAALGLRASPAFGFIYPTGSAGETTTLAAADSAVPLRP